MYRQSPFLVFLASFCCLLVSVAVADDNEEDPMNAPCRAFHACHEEASEKFESCQEFLEGTDVDALADDALAEEFKARFSCQMKITDFMGKKWDATKEKLELTEECLVRRTPEAKAVEDFDDEELRNSCNGWIEKYNSASTGDRKKRDAAQRAMRKLLRDKRKSFKACKKELSLLRKECKQLASCCSTSSFCHLEYELHPLHDTIKGYQLDIIEQMMKCREENAEMIASSNDDIVPADQIVDADL